MILTKLVLRKSTKQLKVFIISRVHLAHTLFTNSSIHRSSNVKRTTENAQTFIPHSFISPSSCSRLSLWRFFFKQTPQVSFHKLYLSSSGFIRMTSPLKRLVCQDGTPRGPRRLCVQFPQGPILQAEDQNQLQSSTLRPTQQS